MHTFPLSFPYSTELSKVGSGVETVQAGDHATASCLGRWASGFNVFKISRCGPGMKLMCRKQQLPLLQMVPVVTLLPFLVSNNAL